jgi:HPt (histidine-containing phosphotransfer) domain-containing protein
MELHVRQMSEQLGWESVVELIESFLETTPQQLDELHKLAEDGSAQRTNLARAAHSLKGSSSVFGIANLSHYAGRLQVAAAQPNSDIPMDLIVEMELEFSRASHELIRLRNNLLETQQQAVNS